MASYNLGTKLISNIWHSLYLIGVKFSLFQELVLSIIPNFAHMIDYTTLKHSIVPRVKKLVLGTSILSVSSAYTN